MSCTGWSAAEDVSASSVAERANDGVVLAPPAALLTLRSSPPQLSDAVASSMGISSEHST